jgi:uncharacterized membrane protein
MHLSELHGAATHLAVVAIPVYVLLLIARRFRPGHPTLAQVEPWALGAAVAGIAAAGATGLLVWGEAQTGLRGHAFRNGTAHFWLGIGLGIVVLLVGLLRHQSVRRGRPTHRPAFLAAGAVALAAVSLQGYLGGRMTYEHGVGVDAGGQLAQTGAGAKALDVALARGATPQQAGRAAFSDRGLGCARCHGDLAQGERAPRLAGGTELEQFRRVHAHGLFPRKMVSDGDFAAIETWLRSLDPGRGPRLR